MYIDHWCELHVAHFNSRSGWVPWWLFTQQSSKAIFWYMQSMRLEITRRLVIWERKVAHLRQGCSQNHSNRGVWNQSSLLRMTLQSFRKSNEYVSNISHRKGIVSKQRYKMAMKCSTQVAEIEVVGSRFQKLDWDWEVKLFGKLGWDWEVMILSMHNNLFCNPSPCLPPSEKTFQNAVDFCQSVKETLIFLALECGIRVMYNQHGIWIQWNIWVGRWIYGVYKCNVLKQDSESPKCEIIWRCNYTVSRNTFRFEIIMYLCLKNTLNQSTCVPVPVIS